jgi:hypothetical protein
MADLAAARTRKYKETPGYQGKSGRSRSVLAAPRIVIACKWRRKILHSGCVSLPAGFYLFENQGLATILQE